VTRQELIIKATEDLAGRASDSLCGGSRTRSLWDVVRGWATLLRRGALLGAVLTLMALPGTANAQLAKTPTPYMGWNTYYQVGSETSSIPGITNVNETTIKSVANSLVTTGLAKAGYNIVWLDFGWASGARDRRGNLIVNSTQWPDGMSGLTSYLHGLGLQAGIYTDAGTSGCKNNQGQFVGVGSYGHYQQDANQFAKWRFDAVKMDFCGAGQQWQFQYPHDPRTLYREFSNAVANNSSGRPMILNVCDFWGPGAEGGGLPSTADSSWDTYSWAPANGQSWRTDTDIGFPGNIQFRWVVRNLDQDSTSQTALQTTPTIQNAAGPPGASGITWGHWNDADYLGPGLGMSDPQAQSQFSMWAMVAAPLILGSDPRQLSSQQISMLTNANVIAIDQDSLGAQGYALSQPTTTGQQVWVKPLASGGRAVALFNRGTSDQTITTSASAVGMPSANQYTLLDAWTNQTTTTTGNITATVPANAVVLYRVTPANTPAPIVTTGSSTSVSSTSATVSGTVNPQGQPTTYHFDYGTDTNYGSTSPASPPYPSAGSGTTAQPESANLTGLTAGVTYHYRIEATNASGTTYGADQTFTTTGGNTVGPPSGPTTAPQGSWVRTYGGSGYDLAAWNGGNDVVSMPGVSVSLAQGSRYLWWSNTTDVRALESADQSTRNAATYYDANQIQVQLNFSSSYSGNLELYAVDLDKCGGGRQETITIGNQTANLSSDFSQGAWVVYPITVPVPATLTITVNHIAGCNAVLSGIFLN
jgi:hypothetical protein